VKTTEMTRHNRYVMRKIKSLYARAFRAYFRSVMGLCFGPKMAKEAHDAATIALSDWL